MSPFGDWIFLSVIELYAVSITKNSQPNSTDADEFYQWLLVNFKKYNDNIWGILFLIFFLLVSLPFLFVSIQNLIIFFSLVHWDAYSFLIAL